ncbi:MAG: gluconokinase [Bacillota bacterium]|nr:gluconokinase [Bacillota bacterium]
MKEYFMGVDIGTSSVKAVVFDFDGIQKSIGQIGYSVISSANGKMEIDPELVFNSMLKAVKICMDDLGINNHAISGIGFSSQMHSLMAVDGTGEPLTGLVIWADTRARDAAAFIGCEYDTADLYYRTGCKPDHPSYPLSKILWLKNNYPGIFNKACKFITIKEYIIFKLFGVYCVDSTTASSQGYYNIHGNRWDEDILNRVLGIDSSRLGDVVECTHILKGFKPEYESILGLNRDIPVAIGSGDGISANVGCGSCDEHSLSCTIGTSGAIRIMTGKPILDSQSRTWCYSFLKDKWVLGGAVNNGGIALKWLEEQFGEQFKADASKSNNSIYKLFDKYSDEIKPGSDGLIFLPQLTGERCPDWNSGAKGLMFGLTYSHGRKHLVKAAMEGVMYRMYWVYEVISGMCASIKEIRANGGYSESQAWLKIQADIFGTEILVSGVSEASALGAAYLSMVSLGAADFNTLLKGMEPRMVVYPDRNNHEVYTKMYRQAMKLYNNVYS